MIIRDVQQLFALLEDGDFARDLMKDLNDALQKCRDAAGPKGKAKAAITLKLDLTVQGVSADLDCDYAVKLPKIKRVSTPFFATDQGFSDQHPKQMEMPGIRDVSAGRMAAAGE